MLTVTGNLVVLEKINQKTLANGSEFINLIAVAKHPRKKKTVENPEAARIYYKLSILVPKDKTEEANKAIVTGKPFQLRFGELNSSKTDNGAIFNDIKTSWNYITLLNGIPS